MMIKDRNGCTLCRSGTNTAHKTTQRNQPHVSLNISWKDIGDESKIDAKCPPKDLTEWGEMRSGESRLNKRPTDEVTFSK